MPHPIGIELFSGCGGLSTGFLDAGLRVSGGFDIDRRSIEAYNYNHLHRGSRGFVADLSQTSGAQLLALAGLAKVDFILGGPPCQPFSIAGKRGGGNDKRAELIGEYLRLTDELRPRFILFENVPNLAVVDDGQLLRRFARGLNRLGYTVNYEVMAAADYGVPQIRRRLILVGGLDSAIELPEPTHGIDRKSYVTAQQAIGDLPAAGDYGESGIYNHEPTEHSLDMLARFALLPPGKREPRSFHDRLHPDRPSYTLRAGTGNFSPLRPIHYYYDRVVTVRESARLQSFDDTFIWPDCIRATISPSRQRCAANNRKKSGRARSAANGLETDSRHSKGRLQGASRSYNTDG